ncbi:hypothetical protein ABIQ69_11460 [Agromyces sp. G08B096]|uniref:Uncharacterized protein n=1 Tax=Agromyces sp. G08B096 TaxID=3156399 RepID=A0AAU7W5F8_9MICO
MSTVHFVPDGDLIEHDITSDDCVCGPTTQPVEWDDGTTGWLVTHASLDGREVVPSEAFTFEIPGGAQKAPDTEVLQQAADALEHRLTRHDEPREPSNG